MDNNSINKLLIEQLKSGNKQAFDRLYKIYSPRVFSFSLSLLKDSAEAEEIVQEVFLKIWENRKKLSTSFSFESFLFTISKNLILNTIRKIKYHRSFLEYNNNNSESSVLIEDELDYKELNELYQKAIDKLSPRKKEIYILNRKQALSHIEIAKKLGISAKTVRNQIDAAAFEIRQLLNRYYITRILILLFFVK